MGRAVLFFALIFAMLASTLHPESAAHASDSYAATHAVHDHGHADVGESAPDDGQSDDNQRDDGMPHHHHCPNAWVPDAQPRIVPQPCSTATVVAANYRALPSRSDDPLLEPPSA
jgi:hypothetical protein